APASALLRARSARSGRVDLALRRGVTLGVLFRAAGDECLHPLLECTALKQYPAGAGTASNAEIGAKANDLPFQAATGVLLPKAHDVAQAYLHYHGSPPSQRRLAHQIDATPKFLSGLARRFGVAVVAGGVEDGARGVEDETRAFLVHGCLHCGPEVALLRAYPGNQDPHVRADITHALDLLRPSGPSDDADVTARIPFPRPFGDGLIHEAAIVQLHVLEVGGARV